MHRIVHTAQLRQSHSTFLKVLAISVWAFLRGSRVDFLRRGEEIGSALLHVRDRIKLFQNQVFEIKQLVLLGCDLDISELVRCA